MNGVKQRDLEHGLGLVSVHRCGYNNPTTCDCKFGIPSGASDDERTGCPEVSQARAMITALTPIEFWRLCKRARISVWGLERPTPKKRKPKEDRDPREKQ